MEHLRFDVIIVGAGPAGAAAAGALAGTGISVALLEAGVYAGAENWSGCVYFAENLAAADCFGPDAVAAAPFERRVVRRGTLLHNGLDVVGAELSDPDAFRDCYTVLRPVYDPFFASLARRKGAVLAAETTVTSLIRRNGRVTGVLTNRGPLFADVVFIAEGDASHLVRSEGLERVSSPHYFQGVKAVLSLPAGEIERRFRLKPGEGAAYELLIRNAAIGGRTAALNAGGFLYTNRDSLSLGYVVPLENLKSRYRGDHDRLFEWVRGLPYVRDLADGAALSSYGTKIIRSGGWKERPVLVEDGLAVGGASTGLGIDIPFPNFTGPASATGLYFARAVRNILKNGRTPDAKNLTREYLSPLRDSVYGRNARYLTRWPSYFGTSRVLFGRTVDMACGSARFLSERNIVETGRFLRGHLLSVRGLKELFGDTFRALGALRLKGPAVRALLNPVTIASWIVNLAGKRRPDDRIGIIVHVNGRDVDGSALPWPVGGLVRRLSPGLRRSLELLYANDGRPLAGKLAALTRTLLRSLSLADVVLIPAFAAFLLLVAAGTAAWDAFRYYVLKVPVEKLLAEPVMAYQEAQRKVRDLDAVKPSLGLDAKLATNTPRVGSTSHIRTLWPATIASQPDMAKASLWWVCPARVYGYDAPLLGRGRVTVNYENCIKCETCWRAEPDRALWGRHTDHKLIYRPQSAAVDVLLRALDRNDPPVASGQTGRTTAEERLWYVGGDLLVAFESARRASRAFRDSVSQLPVSVDAGRRAWAASLGKRLNAALLNVEHLLANDGRYGQSKLLQAERTVIDRWIEAGAYFPALYGCLRVETLISAWAPEAEDQPPLGRRSDEDAGPSAQDAAAVFPDRIVKQWEEDPMPGEWAATLQRFIIDHAAAPAATVRALSFVSPALGLVAAHHLAAAGALTGADTGAEPGLCAVDGAGLAIREDGDRVHVGGTLHFVPLAAASALLLLSGKKGYIVPLTAAGISATPAPAIGFRAAGLTTVSFDCTAELRFVPLAEGAPIPDARSYLAVALGAADYLSVRVKEHATGRIQFPGQMLDTEGRDGIAKLGAVKAMIARVEAWRLLLEALYEPAVRGATGPLQTGSGFGLLLSTIAASAFSPEPGSMGYDAGQVFGGFAYSEDDLLSRFYRDSALFRFLAPGFGAAAALQDRFGARGVDEDGIPPAFRTPRSAFKKEPLGPLADRLSDLDRQHAALPAGADLHLSGQASALCRAVRGLLANVEQELNAGMSSEVKAAAAEVLLDLAADGLHNALLSAGRGSVPPSARFPSEPRGAVAALDMDYESFCTAPAAPHRSGSFLMNAFDRAPRFVPEIQLHDDHLRTRWTELAEWFKKNCRDKSFEGMFIERYIERIHGLPDDIVKGVKENKWLATYIPATEDGLGWRKAEYYILNSAAGTYGDAGINLLIMANTSIGTTPILLGLEEELPRVREELAPLSEDSGRLGEIGAGIKRIVDSFAAPNPAWIKKEYESLMKLVDERIRRTRVVKYLAANFLRAFYGGGMAGQRGDFAGFTAGLKRAAELFEGIMPDVRAALDELPRRERCHRLFLRFLGHDGVSAFALTEPTAGSDSGGVKTTARLHTARLTALPDGRYSFRLREDDEKTTRYLIDADRILFLDTGIGYRTPDDGTAPVEYDRYDYATDQGVRYYVYEGKPCEFHDIGQVRSADNGQVYEYYSLTGAKMWITNGSMATQFCLFAQTAEGVTGFMVDRHAEGLKVGADERKMGQRGSPTNEISIDGVRVAREAVIGYEGHGQVNALETLNVGRCGLAVVSGALMHKLLDEAADRIAPSAERDRLLGEAAAVLFGSESLAFYLVGLFDRPHESVRMESAIAKYACSEDIHELLSLVEQAFGPRGQTEELLLEKARRDARILTIYEGTNEVQRFLILKDLIAQAPSWTELVAAPGDAAAQRLAEWKNRLGLFVKETAALLGETAWSDAMLQPALFPLSEMAGEILRLECIFYRLEWLDQRKTRFAQADPDYAPSLANAGKRAAERAEARLKHLQQTFERAWLTVRQNLDMPQVRAADAALDAAARPPAALQEDGTPLAARLRVLCILRPVADLSPKPRLSDGVLAEIVRIADPLDGTALAQALGIKALSGGQVSVDALLIGTSRDEHLLRESAGAADRLVRLDAESAGPAVLAESLRTLELDEPYDLVVVGADCLDGDQSLGPALAGLLGRRHYRKDRIAVKQDGLGLEHVSPPAVISITRSAPVPLPPLSIIARAAAAPIILLTPQGGASAQPRFERPAAGEAEGRTITTVDDAAAYLGKFAEQARSSQADEYRAEPGRGRTDDGDAVWTVLDPRERKANVAVLRAGRRLADCFGLAVHAVVPAPREGWPSLLGLAQANGADRAFCIDTKEGMLSIEGKRELLRMLAGTGEAPFILTGAFWIEALGIAAGEGIARGKAVKVFGGLGAVDEAGQRTAVLDIPVYHGRLVRKERLQSGPAYLTVLPDAEFDAPSSRPGFDAAVLEFPLDEEWLMPLPPEAGPTLAQADVIIDVGYGIRDRSGLDLAEKLGKKLESLGLAPLFGATRKVTQDLKLLPMESQIGQTGVRVNPKLIIALGISGAPQHVDYVGTRADILCFNKDPDAPLMKLNKDRPAPVVHPIAGDLFVTVPQLIEKLGGT